MIKPFFSHIFPIKSPLNPHDSPWFTMTNLYFPAFSQYHHSCFTVSPLVNAHEFSSHHPSRCAFWYWMRWIEWWNLAWASAWAFQKASWSYDQRCFPTSHDSLCIDFSIYIIVYNYNCIYASCVIYIDIVFYMIVSPVDMSIFSHFSPAICGFQWFDPMFGTWSGPSAKSEAVDPSGVYIILQAHDLISTYLSLYDIYIQYIYIYHIHISYLCVYDCVYAYPCVYWKSRPTF